MLNLTGIEIFTIIISLLGLIWGLVKISYKMLEHYAKRYFEHHLQVKLEDHKRDINKILEEHKKQLERIAFIHQVQFSSLHKERGEVIKILYTAILDCKASLFLVFNTGLEFTKEEFDKEIENLAKNLGKFTDTYHRNKIFFSNNTCEIINNYNLKIKVITNDLSDMISYFEEEHHVMIDVRDYEGFLKLQNEFEDIGIFHLDPLIEKLEKEFREMLGVV